MPAPAPPGADDVSMSDSAGALAAVAALRKDCFDAFHRNSEDSKRRDDELVRLSTQLGALSNGLAAIMSRLDAMQQPPVATAVPSMPAAGNVAGPVAAFGDGASAQPGVAPPLRQ